MNKIVEQVKIPAEIKISWSTTKLVYPPDLRTLMKQTLEQQENEMFDIEKIESNLLLFNEPESSSHDKETSVIHDSNFLNDFCGKGPKFSTISSILKTIRLGRNRENTYQTKEDPNR